MEPVLLSGSGNPLLAAGVARELRLGLGRTLLERFPDDELHVEVREDVRGRDVVLLQSLPPPADRALLELLLLADACRRGGARSVSAALPYLAYSRQDRRGAGGGPLAARVIAELLQCGGIERVVAVDLHSPAVEACFSIPVERLSAIPLLADELRAGSGPGAVVVSPDLGGVPRAEALAQLLHLPVAVVHKRRISGGEVSVGSVTGDVRGRPAVVVDDMITTGGTIEAAVHALRAAGCSGEIAVAATHPLLVGGAIERLGRLSIQRLVTTDTLPSPGDAPFPIHHVSVAPLIAGALGRSPR